MIGSLHDPKFASRLKRLFTNDQTNFLHLMKKYTKISQFKYSVHFVVTIEIFFHLRLPDNLFARNGYITLLAFFQKKKKKQLHILINFAEYW